MLAWLPCWVVQLISAGRPAGKPRSVFLPVPPCPTEDKVLMWSKPSLCNHHVFSSRVQGIMFCPISVCPRQLHGNPLKGVTQMLPHMLYFTVKKEEVKISYWLTRSREKLPFPNQIIGERAGDQIIVTVLSLSGKTVLKCVCWRACFLLPRSMVSNFYMIYALKILVNLKFKCRGLY